MPSLASWMSLNQALIMLSAPLSKLPICLTVYGYWKGENTLDILVQVGKLLSR